MSRDSLQARLRELVAEADDPELAAFVARLQRAEAAETARRRDEELQHRGLMLSLVQAVDHLRRAAGMSTREPTAVTPEGLCELLVELAMELERSRSRAEASSVAKSAFMATMSHEIRTPMNGVVGLVDLLARTDLQPQQRRFVQRIQSSAEHLMAIIDDVLEFSRLEAGRMELDARPFRADELGDEVVALFEAKAREKRIRLAADFSGSRHSALGDPHRIRQILINLVSNAIKFTERGSVLISSEVQNLGEQLELRMSVTDTGLGMSGETCRKIFDAFVQADGSMARTYGGSGLGLAISRRLARTMGGELSVLSTLGIGSRFDLDLILPVAAEPTTEEIEAATGGGTPEQLEGLRVLVVEDNPVNQMVVTEMLEHLGLEFEMAADGEEAVSMYRPERYALVLMDCQMPRMNGYDATRVIREGEAGQARVPIIGLTANAFPEDRARSIEVGMSGFLPKPFTLDALRDAMLEQLEVR